MCPESGRVVACFARNRRAAAALANASTWSVYRVPV